MIYRRENVKYKGNLLFTGPEEIPQLTHFMMDDMARANFSASLDNSARPNYGAVKVTLHETLDTVRRHTDKTPLMPLGSQTTGNSETKYEVEHETQTT